MLGPVVDPQTVHQAKFSMGTVLGLIAFFGRAGVREFESSFKDPRVAAFREKVSMEFDPEIEKLYPHRWGAKVVAQTAAGRTLECRIEEPKGDPGNTLTRSELSRNALTLVEYSGAATPAEMRALFSKVWRIESAAKLTIRFYPPSRPPSVDRFPLFSDFALSSRAGRVVSATVLGISSSGALFAST